MRIERGRGRAREYQEKSLALRDPAVDKLAIADSLTNIGVANYSRGDYTMAMDYHNKALALREAAGARTRIDQHLLRPRAGQFLGQYAGEYGGTGAC